MGNDESSDDGCIYKPERALSNKCLSKIMEHNYILSYFQNSLFINEGYKIKQVLLFPKKYPSYLMNILTLSQRIDQTSLNLELIHAMKLIDKTN